jgi:hypothetical protein
MSSVFFSYSHKDQALRDELEAHLAMMKRNGEITAWHDHMIPAGAKFDDHISKELNTADVILLLISSDFLASDYCYEIEKSRALERQQDGSAVVIPIILRSCEWKQTALSDLKCLPLDALPITKWPDRDDAFLNVVEGIRRAISATPSNHPITPQVPELTESPTPPSRSSNLRIKKIFTEADIDDFRDEAFEYFATFFEKSLIELEARFSDVQGRFKRIDATHFSAEIYRDGKSVGKAHIRHGDSLVGGIIYSRSPEGGSYNEILSIETGDYSLSLEPMGISHIRTKGLSGEPLTQHEAADFFWDILLAPLQ